MRSSWLRTDRLLSIAWQRQQHLISHTRSLSSVYMRLWQFKSINIMRGMTFVSQVYDIHHFFFLKFAAIFLSLSLSSSRRVCRKTNVAIFQMWSAAAVAAHHFSCISLAPWLLFITSALAHTHTHIFAYTHKSRSRMQFILHSTDVNLFGRKALAVAILTHQPKWSSPNTDIILLLFHCTLSAAVFCFRVGMQMIGHSFRCAFCLLLLRLVTVSKSTFFVHSIIFRSKTFTQLQ